MALKIGVVGTGKVAQRNYLPCLAEAEDVSLGYYNRSAAKAEAAAAEFGGEVFDSPHALLDWGPDAVFVLTKETQRGAAIETLLEGGVGRLFLEKPLVASHGQEDVREEDFLAARALMQKARDQGCETAMIFNYRFFDQILKAKDLVAERNFGRVLNITGLVHYACWSHCIDLVHHFAGPVAQVTALQSDQTRGERVPAHDVTVAFRTVDDATGTLIGSSAPAWEFPLFELTFNFEGGRIHLRDLDGDMEVLDNGSGRHETYSVARDRSRWDHYDASFDTSIRAYLETLRHGQPPPVPGIAGLQELQLEAAIKRSIAQRRPIEIETELPLGV
jgi:predicted dehydrogenase